MRIKLEKRQVNGGRVTPLDKAGYRMSLPELPAGQYGLSQVDDYAHLPRWRFPHQPPLRLRLEARVSANVLPGTWGFGLWNDPFSFGFGGGGMARLLPVLPNAAWFFYGSQHNHLTLDDDQPGAGFHAKVFRSPRLPSIFSLFAVPGLPFLFWPMTARLLRRCAARLTEETTTLLPEFAETWQPYELLWKRNQVVFSINHEVVLETNISPQGRLGLVIWIDNQYFRFDPEGKLGFGFLSVSTEQWLEIRGLIVSPD